MFQNKTEIANLALSHLGVGATITDLDTDTTIEAKALRTFYQITEEAVLRAFRWGFAKKTATLTLIEENPTMDWFYSYAYPSDCCYAYEIVSPVGNPNRLEEVPYELHKGASQTLIYTNMDEAQLRYIAKIADTDNKPSDFVMAHSLRLAIAVMPKLSKGNYSRLLQNLYGLYNEEIRQAASTNAREQRKRNEPLAELISQR